MAAFFTFTRFALLPRLLLGLGILLLLFLYFRQIAQQPLWDFDAGRNYQILQKLTQHDFQDFFHHLSPLFYLLYWPFFQISDSPVFLTVLSVLCTLAALGVAYRAFGASAQGLWVFFWASSFFMVHAARYFSIEAPSLLCWLLWLYCFFQKKGTDWQQDVLLAALLLINYKAVLLISIGAALAWPMGIFSIKRLLQAALRIGLVLGAFMLLGWVWGLPWYRYPASFLGLLQNPTLQGSQNNQFEWTYYFEYFIYFENPLLFFSVFVAIYLFFKKQMPFFSPQERYILLSAFLYFVLMSLLPKAPRGLLFCYPIFYWAAYKLWQQALRAKPWLLYGVLAGSLILQIFRLDVHLYQPAPNPYPQVAAYLHTQNITSITTTASLALLPYTKKALRLQVLVQPESSDTLHTQGLAYILIDDAYQVAALQHFDSLAALPPLRTWQAAHWGRTMLHLEHSEFTGKSFEASLEAAGGLRASPPQIRLVVLPKVNDAARKLVE